MDEAEIARARRVLLRRDKVLRELIRQVGRCQLSPRSGVYRSLIRSVLYQQLAGSAAAAIERRFKKLCDGKIPNSHNLLKIPEAKLKAAGLSRQKVAAVRSIALAFKEGLVSPHRISRMEDDEIIKCLTQIHGVGDWTAHMILIFSLGRPDVLPFSDLGIQKAVERLYELKDLPKRSELEAIAESWRPYRSVASWYLWRSHDDIDF